MQTIGHIEQCGGCGRRILVENILNGTNHTLQIIVNCWDCCSQEVKDKAKQIYRLEKL